MKKIILLFICARGIVLRLAQRKSLLKLPLPATVPLTLPLIAAGMIIMAALGRTPVNGGLVGGTTVPVDTSPGDQNDPHVRGNLIVYTNNVNNTPRIHYFDATTNLNSSIPASIDDNDLLADVSGNRITFSRASLDRTSVMLYDVSTATLTELDPAPGTSRFGSSISGNTVAYTDDFPGQSENFAYDLATNGPLINLSASSDLDEHPDVAPDGNAVVWQRHSGGGSFGIMKAVRTSGVWSAPQVVSDTSDSEASPATDGTTVVYDANRFGSATGYDIYFQPLSGGGETQLKIQGIEHNPTISNGIIAFEHTDVTPGAKSDLFVYVIATNTLWQVTDSSNIGEHLNDISVLPNGNVRVVWAGDDNQSTYPEHNIFTRAFSLDGDNDGVSDNRDNCPTTPNPAGIVFHSNRDGDREIYLMNPDGSSQTPLTNNTADDMEPWFSPDGSRIAFLSNRDGNFEIYVMNANGSNPVDLSNNPAFEELPAFSPDSSKIAFRSDRDGNSEIYIMDANGSNQIRLTTNAASERHPSFSPDGSRLTFRCCVNVSPHW